MNKYILENIDTLLGYKEKYGLFFDARSCEKKYSPKLKQFDDSHDMFIKLSEKEVENLTNAHFEDICFITCLVDVLMDTNDFKGNKRDYLKKNLPLVLFCSEILAEECTKLYSNKRGFLFNIDQLAEILYKELAYSFPVKEKTKSTIKSILKNPAFLPILDKKLHDKDFLISSSKYLTSEGKESSSKNDRDVLSLSLSRPKMAVCKLKG